MMSPPVVPPSPQVAAALAAYPPPYRLTGTLACVPAWADATAVAAATGVPPAAAGGRTLVVVLLAAYTHISAGPQHLRADLADGRPYGYREVAWLAPAGWGLTPRVAFGRLWADAPDALPIDLAQVYGFPKVAGTVGFALEGRTLAVDASGVRVGLQTGLPLPSWLALLSPALRGVFPATGRTARLALVRAGRVRLASVTAWDAPALVALDAHPLGWGILFTDATIHVGPPEP